jgi:hypothetical protein
MIEMSIERSHDKATKRLPPGLSEEQARREKWTFQPGPKTWKPPEGYDPEKVCRELLNKNLNSEQIQSIKNKGYFSSAGDDGKYYAFSPREFCEHQTPTERPKAEAFLRKNNIKVLSV